MLINILIGETTTSPETSQQISPTSPFAIFIYALVLFLLIGLIAVLIIIREYKNTNTVLIREKKTKKSLDVFAEGSGGGSGTNAQKNRNVERFSELTLLDKSLEKAESVQYDYVTSLKEFSESFRNYCATKKNLYYTIQDIRAFISNLATSKIMILQGMSETGKTSIALAFEDFIGNQTTVIAVQPMWKERSDLVGYFNEFTKKFNETPLLKELYRANFDDQIYIIVLDEVNIARIEYYFAEFLSLLEYPNIEQRTLEITNDSWAKDPKLLTDGRLKIKPNVYFLGTANNDESTFSISDKVYDRAMILNLDKKAEAFVGEEASRVRISNDNFEKLIKEAKDDYKNYDALDEKIDRLNKIINDHFQINFGNRMVNQLKTYIPVYIACGGNEDEAFDDFVTRKILRKLEGKDALKINSEITPFIDELNTEFGKEAMPLAKEYVSTFIING